ncbi:GNAT family N-acetyltransferase [Nitrospira defluvii]|nr:GNAT family N-acetyltransferase [Nitrospira defluvii]
MIKGKKIVLRKVTKEDVGLLYRWRNDSELCCFYGEVPFHSILQTKRDLINDPSNPHWINFIVETNSSVPLGIMTLRNIDYSSYSAEIVARLGKRGYLHRGYGLDAAFSLLIYCFETLRLHRIYAQILEFSQESMSLAKAIGMKQEAVLKEDVWSMGRFWNKYIYGILDDEFEIFLKSTKAKRYLRNR